MLSKFVTSKGGELRCEPTFIFCQNTCSFPVLSDKFYRFHSLRPMALQVWSPDPGLVRRAGYQAPPIAPEPETPGCGQHPVSVGPPAVS